jgi:hypothetical protein
VEGSLCGLARRFEGSGESRHSYRFVSAFVS